MSFSKDGTPGLTIGPSTIVAAGFRGVYERTIAEPFVLRGLFEVERVFKPASISDMVDPSVLSTSPVALAWGIGCGGVL